MNQVHCSRKAFEARCVSRGYSVDEAAACIVAEDGDTLTVDRDHPAFPAGVRAGFTPAPVHRRGLGDMVAAGLAAVGITKERVSRAIGKPCGCDKRQAWLNEAGKRIGIG